MNNVELYKPLLDADDPDFCAALESVLNARREDSDDVSKTVSAILADVKDNGDQALIACTERFDGFTPTADSMRISAEELDAAASKCAPQILSALKMAAIRIADFHRRQLPDDLTYVDGEDVTLGLRWNPLDAVGIYVPGGTAAYPSSVLMNAIPAKVAGVQRLVMMVPSPQEKLNPLVLAAARMAGVDEVYRVGGAQAIGALAYGTKTIAPVDMIAGPGNAYVAEAKRQVFGIVGIDMIAGPSEVLVLADGTNNASWIAADLLSQAEHDTASQAILITDDRNFADTVNVEIEVMLDKLPRADIARRSWQDHGCIIIVKNIADALPIIDRIAPEHLELALDNAQELASRIRHAGAIFIGRFTAEAIGDYIAGPSHVLPTSRSARFASGLGVINFMKRSSIIGCTAKSLAAIGPDAVILAKAEGLDAHAISVALRLKDSNKK